MAKVKCNDKSVKPQIAGEKRVATCFSLGVDSFYTLEKNKTDIDYLVLVHGFDVPLNNDKWFSELHKKAKKIAEQYNKKLIVIKTNLREHHLYKHMAWAYVGYGSALAAIAFLITKEVNRFFISASIVDGEDFQAAGRIDITPLWGNKKLAIEQKGGELSRAEKLGYLLANEVALDNLSVCWSHPDNYANCGVCEKCIRTQIVLVLYNTYEGNKIFPHNDIDGLIDAISNASALTLDEVLIAAYKRSFLNQGLPRNLEAAIADFIDRAEETYD